MSKIVFAPFPKNPPGVIKLLIEDLNRIPQSVEFLGFVDIVLESWMRNIEVEKFEAFGDFSLLNSYQDW